MSRKNSPSDVDADVFGAIRDVRGLQLQRVRDHANLRRQLPDHGGELRVHLQRPGASALRHAPR